MRKNRSLEIQVKLLNFISNFKISTAEIKTKKLLRWTSKVRTNVCGFLRKTHALFSRRNLALLLFCFRITYATVKLNFDKQFFLSKSKQLVTLDVMSGGVMKSLRDMKSFQ